jgi:hypothetical protein
MTSRGVVRVLAGVAAAMVLASACSNLPGFGKATNSPAAGASPSGTPLAKASGRLDAEVPLPPGFPPDVPVYKGARLTAGASFTSSGQVAWGMEWETVDVMSQVQAYYEMQFDQGDWKLKPVGSSPTSWSATITRKSNSRATGTIAVNADQTVTRILLSLLSPG